MQRRRRAGGRIEDLRRVAGIALPVCLTGLTEWTLGLISLAYVGHLDGGDRLPGVALAASFANATLFLAYGYLGAMDTLVSQAFGGSNLRLVGLTLQRGVLSAVVGWAVVSATWLSVEPLLTALGESEEDSRVAGEYLRYAFPGLLPYLLYNVLQRFLQAQEKGLRHMVGIGVVVNCVHLALTELLVHRLGLGFVGVPVALSLSRLCFPLLLLGVTLAKGWLGGAWTGWSSQALDATALWEFAKLGVPAGGMIFIETLAYEQMVVESGYLGDTALSAMSIVSNWYLLVWLITASFRTAATVLVGQHLGSCEPQRARRFAGLAVGLTLSGALLVTGPSMYVLRRPIARIFSSDPAVLAATSDAFRLASATHVVDVTAACLGGVLVGAARPSVGVALNLLGYYGVMSPLGYLLAFRLDRGLPGLWEALACALTAIAAGMLGYVLRLDWAGEAQRAQRFAAYSPLSPVQ